MAQNDALRKIIHIDMDAFYASVEQRDHPEYRGKPVIVGGMPNTRGVVATCSYEARKFGIYSAMSSFKAYQLCPEAIFVEPRFDAYREASYAIRSIFAMYTDLIEPLSLDEAYLDVSKSELCNGSATLIANDIKKNILKETCLTSSAGVSYNKFLAKIASDINKPNGVFVIPPGKGEAFVDTLAIGKFHGIGKVTEKRMHELGIKTGSDLKKLSLQELLQNFGKSGHYYYQIARGIDDRPVCNDDTRQSIGVENTFQKDIEQPTEMVNQLIVLLGEALEKATKRHFMAQTVTIKVKYFDFVQVTRSKTLPTPIKTTQGFDLLFYELLKTTDVASKSVRLLGVSLSSLIDMDSTEYRQMDLFI